MNKFIEQIKKVSILKRLMVIAVAFAIIGFEFIPDIAFHLQSSKKVNLSYKELMSMPKDQIPRYISISDAVVPGDSYVESRKKDRLACIYYPVQISDTLSADKKIKIVVEDRQVKEAELKSGSYFSSPTFAIEGKFTDSPLDDETKSLLAGMGTELDANVIVIKRNDDPISMPLAILFSILALAVAGLFIISFVPAKN